MTLNANHAANRAYVLTGDLINERHRQLNAAENERGASYDQNVRSGAGVARSPYADLQVLKVTDASASLLTSRFVGDDLDHPSSQNDLYTVQSRFYDQKDNDWSEDDENFGLDAAGYVTTDPNDAVLSPVTVDSKRQIPAYAKGDTPCSLWLDQRGMFMPLQDPYQDVVHAEFISKTTQLVPIMLTSEQGPVDSMAYVYLEILRPDDDEWLTVAALAWQLPSVDRFREWRETRSGFAMFDAPHDTLMRFRHLHSSQLVDPVHVLATNFTNVQFWGAGRDSVAADFVLKETQSFSLGAPIIGWSLRADNPGRFKDAPTFLVNSGDGLFKVQYQDPLDSWIIGARFTTSMFGETQNPKDKTLTVVTSIKCGNQTILEYCTREITIPSALADLITIGPEICVDCDNSSSSSSSSLSTTSQSSSSSSQSESSSSSQSSSSESSSPSSQSSSVSSESSESSLSSIDASVSDETMSDPGCGVCSWEWDGSLWQITTNECTGLCSCVYPEEEGQFVGQTTVTDCALLT